MKLLKNNRLMPKSHLITILQREKDANEEKT